MKAQLARFAISVIGMLIALIAFMALGTGWMPVIAAALIAFVGFVVAESVFRRLADSETLRRDLEDRVRNPPP